MLGPRVEVVIVLDFMCPWSFIGMQSFQLAQQALQERFTSNSPDGECGAAPLLSTRFIPYEFDLPGTYPPEGKDWTEYCQGYGPAKAEFLLKEKLPRAFGIGKALGIDFNIARRIVHTNRVNCALMLAQEFDAAEPFVMKMLSAHFEGLQDPNQEDLLQEALVSVGVSGKDIGAFLSEPEEVHAARNAELRAEGQRIITNGVPKFEVWCRDDGDGTGAKRLVQPSGNDNSPTSPAYFEELFLQCFPNTPQQ